MSLFTFSPYLPAVYGTPGTPDTFVMRKIVGPGDPGYDGLAFISDTLGRGFVGTAHTPDNNLLHVLFLTTTVGILRHFYSSDEGETWSFQDVDFASADIYPTTPNWEGSRVRAVAGRVHLFHQRRIGVSTWQLIYWNTAADGITWSSTPTVILTQTLPSPAAPRSILGLWVTTGETPHFTYVKHLRPDPQQIPTWETHLYYQEGTGGTPIDIQPPIIGDTVGLDYSMPEVAVADGVPLVVYFRGEPDNHPASEPDAASYPAAADVLRAAYLEGGIFKPTTLKARDLYVSPYDGNSTYFSDYELHSVVDKAHLVISEGHDQVFPPGDGYFRFQQATFNPTVKTWTAFAKIMEDVRTNDGHDTGSGTALGDGRFRFFWPALPQGSTRRRYLYRNLGIDLNRRVLDFDAGEFAGMNPEPGADDEIFAAREDGDSSAYILGWHGAPIMGAGTSKSFIILRHFRRPADTNTWYVGVAEGPTPSMRKFR